MQRFKSIDEAILQLGHPDVVWLRGHTRSHRLIPWLFRLFRGSEEEESISRRYLTSGISVSNGPHLHLEIQIEMHRNYVPTRLIEWTDSVRIVLFCALAREVHAPTIFVLDPVKLNQLNGIEGIPTGEFFNAIGRMSCPETPIAIESRSAQSEASGAQYTVHGRSRLPLEEQCPDCLKKVFLTNEECLMATEFVLTAR